MNFKELQSMLLKQDYMISFQSDTSNKLHTKKCTLKNTPTKVNQSEGTRILVYLVDDKRYEDIRIATIKDCNPC
jgi:hypothetical protein